MKVLLVTAAVAMLVLTAGPSFAGSAPDFDCAKKNEICTERCDRDAGRNKNANRYNQCLADCARSNKYCTEHQSWTNTCAKEFLSCMKGAETPDEKASCRRDYRICKDSQPNQNSGH